MRNRLIGGLLCLAALALVVGGLAPQVPLDSPFEPMARMFDSMAPQLLVVAAGLAGLAMGLGARLAGGVLLLAAVVAGALLVAGHRARALPLVAQAPDLRVLFFNALSSQDPARGARLGAALRAADPDVAVFAEGDLLGPLLAGLRDRWPYQSGCDPTCGIVVLSRWPLLLTETRSPGPVRPDRFVRVQIAPGGHRLDLAVAHLSKPWMAGVVDVELGQVARWINLIRGPVVLVGDFNAAPWSWGMRNLEGWTGIRAVPWPVATWPVAAGALGVPIDNIFVRGGPRVTEVVPFGADLGSNHRGILAGIALAP